MINYLKIAIRILASLLVVYYLSNNLIVDVIAGIVFSSVYTYWYWWTLPREKDENIIDAVARYLVIVGRESKDVDQRHADNIEKIEKLANNPDAANAFRTGIVFALWCISLNDAIFWPGQMLIEMLKWPFSAMRDPLDSKRI